MWLAHDALLRKDATEAVKWLEVPYAARDVLAEEQAKRLVSLFARALAENGDLERAARVETDVRWVNLAVQQTPVELVAKQNRRRNISRLATAMLAGWVIALAPFLGRTPESSRARPLGLIPLTVVLVGTGLAANAWAEGAGASMAWLFPGAVGIHLVHWWIVPGAPARVRPWLRLMTGLATLAAAWLAFAQAHALDWVGW
jgi:hypothetical protein